MKKLILIAMVVLLSSSITLAQDFCKGDFNFNGSVAAEDVTEFLEHFGRSIFNNPCPPDGPAPVAKTGQTISYCFLDDGHLQRGVALVIPRFTDNSDGTVTDNQTGLMWTKDANLFGSENWVDAHYEIQEANGYGWIAGYNDWRLPNVLELESLRDIKSYGPTLSDTLGTGQWSEGDPFNNVDTYYYWSSSTCFGITAPSAYAMFMHSGEVAAKPKVDFYYVWPVRGGH